MGNKVTEEGQAWQTIASPVEEWRAQVHLQGAGTTQLQQPRVTCEEMGQILPDPTIFQENLEICISPNFSMIATNLTEIQMHKPKKEHSRTGQWPGAISWYPLCCNRGQRAKALEREELGINLASAVS